jgi:hypothetical protein
MWDTAGALASILTTLIYLPHPLMGASIAPRLRGLSTGRKELLVLWVSIEAVPWPYLPTSKAGVALVLSRGQPVPVCDLGAVQFSGSFTGRGHPRSQTIWRPSGLPPCAPGVAGRLSPGSLRCSSHGSSRWAGAPRVASAIWGLMRHGGWPAGR